jgi:Fur family ferric uptake transcriptional regulator
MEHSRPAAYNTRQKERILAYLASLGDRHVTVNEIAGHFPQGEIGRTTIYRHLEKLVNAGIVRRYIQEEGAGACYQYIRQSGPCREHFHLKCEKCGALLHLHCRMLDKTQRHILKKHRFKINVLKTVFYGCCENCRGEG